MKPFTCSAQSPRVVFGAGSLARLAEEVDRLGIRRAIVLCTPGQRALGERAAALLGARAAGVFAGAVTHVPQEVVDEARAAARSLGADGPVARWPWAAAPPPAWARRSPSDRACPSSRSRPPRRAAR